MKQTVVAPHPWRLRAATFIRWHRRALAALTAAVMVLAGLTVLAPPQAASVAVLVAATDLGAGHRLTAGDLEVARYPPELVPTGVTSTPETLLGRVLIGPSPRGTPLGAQSVVDASRLPRGRMLVPVRVDDPAVMSLLHAGDLITVIGTDDVGTPVVLARRVRIAAVPGAADPGPLGDAGTGGVVVVDVDEPTAVKLSAWSSNPGLSVTLG